MRLTATRLAVEWLVALAITAVALLLFINGSFFSTWGALNIDLSINLVASHALREGANPYGPTVLFDRAKALGSPTLLVYTQLFTSYIQPPASALSLLPLTLLSWRDATHVYLVLNHVFLVAAVLLMLRTVKPTLPLPWTIAVTMVTIALYSQVYASFALGQLDATLMLLLVIAFWAYTRDRPAVAGSAIAIGAAIKLIPVFVLLYFLLRRQYRAAAWTLGVGGVLFVTSLAYTGTDIYRTYLTETMPALLKGSTHYSNASLGAVIARSHTPEVVNNLPEVDYLSEVPDSRDAALMRFVSTLGGFGLVALVIGWRSPPSGAMARGKLLFEFYLPVVTALIVSSVTWEFYVVWLLPLFVAVFVAPRTLLPRARPLSAVALLLFVVAYVALNYPGDKYLFDPNGVFYHPELVPGIWVEKHVRLYATHLDVVVLLRLGALGLLASLLGFLTLLRRPAAATRPVAAEESTATITT